MWKSNPVFQAWANTSRTEEFFEQSMDAIEDLGENVLDEIRQYIIDNEITYSTNDGELYEDSFSQEPKITARGALTAVEIEILNDAGHAEFIARGTDGVEGATKPPYGLVEWYMEKIGLERRAAFGAAITTFREGTQKSDNSVLRNLPPSMASGFDPVLAMKEIGVLDRLTQETVRNFGRKIRVIYEP